MPCFNGAALVRARKSCETPCRTAPALHASMGPRSCERGNIVHGGDEAAQDIELQWGRARASAEIPALAHPRADARPLQWGRARASAEIANLEEKSIMTQLLQWGRARASAEMRQCRRRCR